MFLIGFGLAALATYLFFWGVMVHTGDGAITGAARRIGGRGGHGRGGLIETTAMAILFVPFILGVITLFYDVTKKWGWWLVYLGIAVLGIEVLSRIRFAMNIRLAHLLGLMILFSAGVGLMLRSYRDLNAITDRESD